MCAFQARFTLEFLVVLLRLKSLQRGTSVNLNSLVPVPWIELLRSLLSLKMFMLGVQQMRLRQK